MRSRNGWAAVGLLLSLGCASAPTQRQSERGTTWTPPGTSLFSPEELARYSQRGSVADLLERAAPALSSRGQNVLVSIDGSAPVERAILATIPASTVLDLRLVRATASASIPSMVQNGRVVSGDVLYVRLRK